MLPTIVPPHHYLTRANALNNTATWQPVLRRTVLRSEVYTIPADSQDSQEPHQEDELYYVLAGSAMIQIAGVDTHVHPGSLIFVPAGAWHHYHSLAGDLSLLVAFAAIPSVALSTAGNRDSSALVISPGQVVPPGKLRKVRYRELVRSPFMSAGVYELPAHSRDHQTPHADDELYYVISGDSEFMLGEASAPTEPGTLIYVPAGQPHFFRQIDVDLRVLAIFAPPRQEPI